MHSEEWGGAVEGVALVVRKVGVKTSGPPVSHL